MEDLIRKARELYGYINILGEEHSDQRYYLTFSAPTGGTFVGVLARYSAEVWIYKLDRRVDL